ncbi:fimbrial biogenesis chaperone [Paraglaciecola polaris]|uniref:Pili assembly chaperone N-terminal domain-containing protein n=1 Tax=Paraglaciecola polaris LMG 21857 TaxID=1129793 RepID=K7A3L3_9ALTE|nr:molecular chaperone [Paraglaciecola polaris]GAC35488.1 hypothetical protein GPLA_4614 [Paraglaciecola polaris LMG 21857]
MKIRFFAHVLTFLLFITSTVVNANLLVSPTYVSFDLRERSKEIVLVNTSNSVQTYRMEWQQKRALSHGGYEAVQDESGFPVASNMLRYSPRQVTLQPNERQVVKLALRKPKGLAAGEYRSHLTLRSLPSQEEKISKQTGFAIDLKLRMSYSLPVVVRQGENDLEINAESVKFMFDPQSAKGTISVNFNRSGSYSSYGDITAYWLPHGSADEPIVVARLSGYSVYTELEKAVANLIWVGAPFEPTRGVLSIVYEGQGRYKGRVLTTKSFKITPSIR